MKSIKIDGYTIIMFQDETDYTEAFLSVPKMIYSSKTCPQNIEEERQLLTGEHVLSKYFRLVPFLLYLENSIIGRGTLTFYPEIPELAYLGFFEMKNDKKGAAAFFTALEQYAHKEGSSRIQGPMNASFWLGYRMKSDRFDEAPYFGEPYNPQYYLTLWRDNGYTVTDEYVSNQYHPLAPGRYRNERYEKRLQMFREKGYIIAPPNKENWDTSIRQVYQLIIKLYSTFPGFSYINEEDFISNFSGLKLILNFSLCRLAYYNGQAVAFAITIPDYGSLLNHIHIGKLPLLLWKRRFSKRHIVLYVGVDAEHKGLGTAMVQELIQEFSCRHSAPIGALIKKGKVTQSYAADYIEFTNNYLLFGKDLSELPQREGKNFEKW